MKIWLAVFIVVLFALFVIGCAKSKGRQQRISQDSGANPKSDWCVFSRDAAELHQVISVDLQARNVDQSAAPYVVRVDIPAVDFRDNGLPSQADREACYPFFDALEALEDRESVWFVGRITSGKGYQLCLYTDDDALLTAKIHELRASHGSRQYSVRHQNDHRWEVYFSEYYPNEDELQGIMDLRVIESLRSLGDDLASARVLDHFFYFSDRANRDMVASLLEKDGFILEVGRSETEPKPWTLHAKRSDVPDLGTISDLTTSLNQLAREHGGDYDGWGCTAVKSAQ